MNANDKVSLNVLRVIAKNVEEFKDLLANEVGTINRDAENRAHIATVGDRPFVGCNPRKPEAPE
jgi:hypothetical protein